MSCSITVVQYMWNIPPLHKFCAFGYSIRKGIAEVLPFPNASVDLLTASSAAHWFDQSKFQAEANRVLKPRGCIALVDYTFANTRLHYKDCGERLTQIFKEVGAWLRSRPFPFYQPLSIPEFGNILNILLCRSSHALSDWMGIISAQPFKSHLGSSLGSKICKQLSWMCEHFAMKWRLDTTRLQTGGKTGSFELTDETVFREPT